jgi:hypothetical protein
MSHVRRQKTEDGRQKTENGFFHFFFFVWSVLIFAGCGPQAQKPMLVCPGAESTEVALSIQKQHFESAVEFGANGMCLLSYYDEQNKRRSENFPVKLWAGPPMRLYLQGDLAFDPKGLVLGSNEREFWLSMRPKEISSYIWGRWSESQFTNQDNMIINPTLLLESLGMPRFDASENWSLSNSGAFDILTKNQAGGIVKKVYVYNCDRLARKIEYLDTDGRVLVVAELDRYKPLVVSPSKPVSPTFWIPSVINIVRHRQDDKSDSVRITLGSIKPMQLTEKQRNSLFSRPEPIGFQHIYKLDENCDMIKQPQ